VHVALEQGRHCLVLTQWTTHLDRLADALHDRGYDPVVLRGGMGAKARAAALTRLQPGAAGPLLIGAIGPYIGEGFDCPALDTLLLAAPIAFNGRLVQYAGRILRPYPGKTTRRGPRLPRHPDPGCSPPPSPAAPPATPASASPIPAPSDESRPGSAWWPAKRFPR